MEIKGKLWYSAKQARIREERGRSPTLPGRLTDGREVRYTEINTGEHEDADCNFDNAVYLGEGEYAGL